MRREYHSARAPLLWILLPVAGGIILSRLAVIHTPSLLVLLAFFFCVSALALLRKKKLAQTLLVGGAFLLAWAYASSLRMEPPKMTGFAPREATLSLRIERIFSESDQKSRLTAIARIEDAPPYAQEAIGHSAFVMLRHDFNQPLYRTQVIEGRGVLEFIGTGKVNRDTEIDADFHDFLRRKQTWLNVSRGQVEQIVNSGNSIYRYIQEANHWMTRVLLAGQPDDDRSELANMYAAMLLGKKSLLSKETQTFFISSGTMHLFAISGLHVGLMAGILLATARLLRLPRWAEWVFGLGLLLFYVQVTGAAPSAVRAWIMIAFFWSSRLTLRKASPLSALVASALVVLLWSPEQLFDPGFQLSYMVVTGILLYGVPLGMGLSEKLRFDPYRQKHDIHPLEKFYLRSGHWAVESLCVSFSAMLFSAPLTVLYFNVFTPASLVLNLVLISLAGLVVAIGALSIFASLPALLFSDFYTLAAFINHGAWVVLSLMKTAVGLFLSIPGSFMPLDFGTNWQAMLTVLLLLTCLFLPRDAHPVRYYLLPPAVLTLALILFAQAV